MKNIFLSLLFIFVTACASAPVQPSPSPALPTATSLPTLTPTPIPWEWRVTGALNFERGEHTATLLSDGTVLVVGGYFTTRDEINAERYDPFTENWHLAGHPKKIRMQHTATLLPSGQVLVVGGMSLFTLQSAELYDPATGEWRSTAKMEVVRQAHTATLLPNGKVLIAGGGKFASAEFYYSEAELYNPETEIWSKTGDLNLARAGHTATLLPNGNVLVAGGQKDDKDLTSAEVYDPSTGRWNETGSLNVARSGHTATLLPNGKVLVAGGINTSEDSAELYDPTTQTWSLTGSLHVARTHHTATLLPAGTVLVVGGIEPTLAGDPALPSAEVYDPITGLWKIIDSPQATRAEHTATLLTNGAVLIIGGLTPSQDRLVSSELYAPTTPNLSATPIVPTAFPTPNASLIPSLPEATTTPTPQLTAHPWIPEAVLIELGESGGDGNFGPYIPDLILYADGNLIFQSSGGLRRKQLERQEICALLNTVEQSGFFDYDSAKDDYSVDGAPFIGGAVTRLQVNAWRSKQIALAELAIILEDPGSLAAWDACPDCSDAPTIPSSLRDVYQLLKHYRPGEARPYQPSRIFPTPTIPQPTAELSCTPEDGVIAVSEP